MSNCAQGQGCARIKVVGAMNGQLLGLGVDVVSITRFEAKLLRWGDRLLERLFCEGEVPKFSEYGHRGRRAVEIWAGRFAIKEAVMKCLGLGLGSVPWRDIRTVRFPSGQPGVELCGKCLDLAGKAGVGHVWVSLSHSDDVCVAVAVATRGRSAAGGGDS
ncbi:MAG: holo-ACP synthase [Bacillota bacterium]